MKATQVRIQDDGRVQIPRRMIKDLGWSASEIVIISTEGREIRIRSLDDQIERVQLSFAELAPAPVADPA